MSKQELSNELNQEVASVSPAATKVAKPKNGQWRRFVTWFKDTAWIQVLLIIIVIFGVFVSIPYIVRGIQGAVENAKTSSTYYKDNRIKYSELEEKVNRDDGKIVTMIYYSPTCSVCNEHQKAMAEYFGKNGLGKDRVVYTIDVTDDDYITTSDLQLLNQEYAVVYDTEAPEYQTSEYDTFSKASSDGIPTPTIVVYEAGKPVIVTLGIGGDSVRDYFENTVYKNYK